MEMDQLCLKIPTPAGGDAMFRQDRPVITAVKSSCNCTKKHTGRREEGRESTAAVRTPNYLHLESLLAHYNTPLILVHVFTGPTDCVSNIKTELQL